MLQGREAWFAVELPHVLLEQCRAKYGVVYQTARTDLLDLAEKGLLTKYKVGRAYHFRPSGKLDSLGAK